jgi:hypothetical protein
VPDKRAGQRQLKLNDLERFAQRIDAMLRKGKDRTTIERLICRHLTGKDGKVAALLLAKWVSWRFGDPKQRHELTGADGGLLVVHTIRFGNGNGDTESNES